MIAVCDANVLASGFIGFGRSESVPGEIPRRWRNADFTLIYSVELRTELERTLHKPYSHSAGHAPSERQHWRYSIIMRHRPI